MGRTRRHADRDRAVSAVTIRAARHSDISLLAAIEESGAETFARHGQPLADGSPPAPPEQWSEALQAGLLWVADDVATGPIGFLRGESSEDGLYVAEVDVVMERQRQGHGRRLMETAIAHARKNGLASVTLTTFRDIPWNAPFYATLGFEEVASPSRHLAKTLAEEAARGFEGRCAMRLVL
jgi:ribosomal protein S18 acetylase RimI-like enzyme